MTPCGTIIGNAGKRPPATLEASQDGLGNANGQIGDKGVNGNVET